MTDTFRFVISILVLAVTVIILETTTEDKSIAKNKPNQDVVAVD